MSRGLTRQRRATWLSPPEVMWWLLGSTAYLLATLLVVGLDIGGTAAASDQEQFHGPTVEKFAEELPVIDVVNVQTATGPLYHLLLAIPTRLLGLGEGGSQVVAVAFTSALLGLVLVITRGMAFAVRLPVVLVAAFSPYVWQSTLWLSTDAAALLFGLAALWLIFLAGSEVRRFAAVGLAVAVAIATRQTYAWLLLPAAVAALSGPKSGRWTRAVVAVAPGLALLAALVLMWRGLTPPEFQNFNATQASPVGVAYGAALWAFFAIPLLLAARVSWPSRMALVIAAAVGSACGLLAIVFESSYSEVDGERNGGWLWLLVRFTGAVGSRSPLLVLLAAIGAFAVSLLCLEVARRFGAPFGIVLASAVAGSLVASASSSQVFQRYYEPPIVMCFIVAAALLMRQSARHDARERALGAPAVLQVLALAAVVGAPLARVIL